MNWLNHGHPKTDIELEMEKRNKLLTKKQSSPIKRETQRQISSGRHSNDSELMHKGIRYGEIIK